MLRLKRARSAILRAIQPIQPRRATELLAGGSLTILQPPGARQPPHTAQTERPKDYTQSTRFSSYGPFGTYVNHHAAFHPGFATFAGHFATPAPSYELFVVQPLVLFD